MNNIKNLSKADMEHLFYVKEGWLCDEIKELTLMSEDETRVKYFVDFGVGMDSVIVNVGYDGSFNFFKYTADFDIL